MVEFLFEVGSAGTAESGDPEHSPPRPRAQPYPSASALPGREPSVNAVVVVAAFASFYSSDACVACLDSSQPLYSSERVSCGWSQPAHTPQAQARSSY